MYHLGHGQFLNMAFNFFTMPQPIFATSFITIVTPDYLLFPKHIDYVFSSSHVWMWELDYKVSWVPKNWCFWAVVLEKTLESPLDCKDIQPVHHKGNRSWVFIWRTDVEAETPIIWPPDAKSWLIGKDPDAGKDWGQEEKGTTEDEVVGWHHWLIGYGFGWTPGVGDGQGGLECCGSWGHKESDTTEQLNWTETYSLPLCLYSSPDSKSNSLSVKRHPSISKLNINSFMKPLPTHNRELLRSLLKLKVRVTFLPCKGFSKSYLFIYLFARSQDTGETATVVGGH